MILNIESALCLKAEIFLQSFCKSENVNARLKRFILYLRDVTSMGFFYTDELDQLFR